MSGETNGQNLNVELNFPTRVSRKDRDLFAGQVRDGLAPVIRQAGARIPLDIHHYAPPRIDKARIVIGFPEHDVRRQVVEVIHNAAADFFNGRNCDYELIDQATGRSVQLAAT